MKKGTNSGLSLREKNRHMEMLAEYRENTLRPSPELRVLFLEMTIRCNERCRHCGSECGDHLEKDRLTKEEIFRVFDELAEDYPAKKPHLNITGGEPLLRADFFEIMAYARTKGFSWGMTSNGTLITPEVAQKLRRAGMRTISVSVDGMRESHEWFRRVPGSWDRALDGVRNLLEAGGFEHVQITTVVNHRNYPELEEMYAFFSTLGIRSWRVINIEPIGRAKEQPELHLTADELRGMFDFIQSHRFRGPMEVCYGCSHFLGTEREREVRKWYFLCNAGVYTASIMYNGDMTSCLDLPRRPELVEGNVRTRRVKDIWESGYRIYRTDWRKTGKCASCEHYRFCAGDAFHSWDFDKMEPALCMKGILFE